MVEELTPAELVARMRDGEDWQIVDVREPWELGIVSLDDGIAIPLGAIPERHDELDRERPVAVLCHGGMRSYRVALFLADHGFCRVANVSGGIDAWALDVDNTLARY